MNLLQSSSQFPTVRFLHLHPSSPTPLRTRALPVRSSLLPFRNQNAKYYRELEAAVDVVERACRICVDVKKSLFSSEGRIVEKNDNTPVTVADFGVQALVSLGSMLCQHFLVKDVLLRRTITLLLQLLILECRFNALPTFSSEGRIVEKNDNTPVTVADFGVQALVSLELSKVFPSIPLVAEEDSDFVRSNNLVDSVVSVVTDKASSRDKPLTNTDVLEAIDRGGKSAIVYGTRPATYWVLDPIDGTKGFLKGSEALYVVGLALVVEGEIVLGVMGCPNWQEASSYNSTTDVQKSESAPSRSGIIMVAHVGCGTWARRLSDLMGVSAKAPNVWTRCFVDGCHLVPKARFCISDSQTWESGPLSAFFSATSDADGVSDKEVLLLPTCCGSLCKYLMVASGRASVFILRARPPTIIKAWDHAVGIICVHEAGGKVTDWKGSELDLAADPVERRILFPSMGVLVTNGTIHKQILEMISST